MTEDLKPLIEFSNGARVIKPNAIRFDFAFGGTGTVCREVVDGHNFLGVLWDGGNKIYEYPGDILFSPGEAKP